MELANHELRLSDINDHANEMAQSFIAADHFDAMAIVARQASEIGRVLSCMLSTNVPHFRNMIPLLSAYNTPCSYLKFY